MKTFLEHLQDSAECTYPLEDIINNLSADEIVEEVKLYALEACKESLETASKLAYMINGDDTSNIVDGFRICKESITSEENIPKEVRNAKS